MTGSEGVPAEFFHAIYAGGGQAPDVTRDAPWDVGRPQPAVVDLLAAGELTGRVLDVGCGTGDNAIAIARAGASVLAVDLVPAAVERARSRAGFQRVAMELAVADALDLARLGRRFDAVLDSGTFHVFSDEDRPRYVASVAGVLEPGGRLHVLCFSDDEPPGPGPRHVSEAELRATFAGPFAITSIRPARFLLRAPGRPARAFVASFERR